MALGYGLVAAGAQLGLESILIRPRRAIGPFEAHVTLRERHQDDLEVVDHPVEQGAQISDHAFKRPPEVVIECAWSDSPKPSGGIGGIIDSIAGVGGVQSLITGNSVNQVRDVYDKLRALQSSAELIEVVTGKRTYTNMIVKSLTVETDKDTEHVLRVTVVLRQMLIASVRVVAISAPRETQQAADLRQSGHHRARVLRRG
jgi:hypothetical protein